MLHWKIEGENKPFFLLHMVRSLVLPNYDAVWVKNIIATRSNSCQLLLRSNHVCASLIALISSVLVISLKDVCAFSKA